MNYQLNASNLARIYNVPASLQPVFEHALPLAFAYMPGASEADIVAAAVEACGVAAGRDSFSAADVIDSVRGRFKRRRDFDVFAGKPIGTIVNRKAGQFKKIAEGKWVPVRSGQAGYVKGKAGSLAQAREGGKALGRHADTAAPQKKSVADNISPKRAKQLAENAAYEKEMKVYNDQATDNISPKRAKQLAENAAYEKEMKVYNDQATDNISPKRAKQLAENAAFEKEIKVYNDQAIAGQETAEKSGGKTPQMGSKKTPLGRTIPSGTLNTGPGQPSFKIGADAKKAGADLVGSVMGKSSRATPSLTSKALSATKKRESNDKIGAAPFKRK